MMITVDLVDLIRLILAVVFFVLLAIMGGIVGLTKIEDAFREWRKRK